MEPSTDTNFKAPSSESNSPDAEPLSGVMQKKTTNTPVVAPSHQNGEIVLRSSLIFSGEDHLSGVPTTEEKVPTKNRPDHIETEMSPVTTRARHHVRSQFEKFTNSLRLFFLHNIQKPCEAFLLRTDFLSNKSILCLRCISPRQLWRVLFAYTIIVLVMALCWLIAWIILLNIQDSVDSSTEEHASRARIFYGPEVLMPPSGPIFALVVQIFLAFIVGWTLYYFFRLPALLGMLIVGFALRNIPHLSDLPASIPSSWSSALRSFALGTILLKAGLGLNLRALIRLGRTTLSLATLTNIMECVAIAIPAKFLLNIPFLWAFVLGFVMNSVSPAVVVPSMVSMQERGYGTKKGIPSMVLGAASLDDVVSISLFSILNGVIFKGSDNIAMLILHAPIEIGAGIVGGIFLAIACMWPLTLLPTPKYNWLRAVALFGVALGALYGGGRLGYSGSGTLAAMLVGTIVSKLWTQEQLHYMSQITGYVWVVAQPLLFSLIGAQVVLTELKWDVVGYGVVLTICGLVFRILGVFIVCICCCSPLNWKESLFMLGIFLPKGTVQAAIGPIPLSMALVKYSTGASEIDWARNILMLAVLSILLTAPLGAVLIAVSGPLLLKKNGNGNVIPETMLVEEELEGITPIPQGSDGEGASSFSSSRSKSVVILDSGEQKEV